MPINPESGLYDEPQGSMFPNGVFGGALGINNNRLAQGLADEARNRRALQDHMSDLRVEGAELELEDAYNKLGQHEDEFNRGEQFRQWIVDNPQASTTQKLNAALQFGQKDVKHLTDLVQSEATDAFKRDKLTAEQNVDYIGEARKEATEYLAQGLSGKDAAALISAKYKDKIPQLYIDKLSMVGSSPLATATVNARNARAGVDKARVAGTLPPMPRSTTADPEAKLLKERDRLLSIQQQTEAVVANGSGLKSDQEIEIAKIRLNQAKMQLEKVDRELADLRGASAARTPAPIENSVEAKKPPFKPIPAPGRKEGDVGICKGDKSGSLFPCIVRNGQWVFNG